MSAQRKVREFSGCTPAYIPEEVLQSDEPLVLRGLVADWPFVKAAQASAQEATRYLRRFYNGAPVTVSDGPSGIKGRIYYNDDMSGFNFEMRRAPLDEVLSQINECRDSSDPPVHYVGSTSVDYILPGLRDENDLNLGGLDPLVSIWIGNQTCIAAHYDIPDNIACVAAGKRRFTLFPPEQLENLYVGPLDFAPAGQSISTVDLRNPDFDRFPRFRKALAEALIADMEPGDALFIPSMWWHHVEGLDNLNVLINYWWRSSPAYMGTPLNALNHAFLSIRDLPETQRRAWRRIFDHYIFDADEDVVAHIPEGSRGVLSPIDELSARRLRAQLLKQLNR